MAIHVGACPKYAVGVGARLTDFVVPVFQAVVSFCQVLFMYSRAPRVPWEAMYLPATEAVSYGMSFFGEGYVLLANGKVLPYCRYAAWLCTCPIMLGLISNMALIKYKTWSLNPMMVAASIIRTVFGIAASMAEEPNIIRLHAFFAFFAFFIEMACAYAIFSITIQDFTAIGSPLAMNVVSRLNWMRGLFFITWNGYWVYWLLNSSNMCLMDEADQSSFLVFVPARLQQHLNNICEVVSRVGQTGRLFGLLLFVQTLQLC